MATVNELRTKFKSLPTAQKKQYLLNLKQQVESSRNAEHRKFYNECIRRYNAEVQALKARRQQAAMRKVFELAGIYAGCALLIGVVVLSLLLFILSVGQHGYALEDIAAAGNTPGNIASGGYAAINNDRIYYCQRDDIKGLYGIYSMDTDGEDIQNLSDDKAGYINVIDGRIYYINLANDDSCGLYSMQTDGSDRQKLSDDGARYMTVADGWIYYSNADDGGKLYKLKTDGSERVKLNDDNSESVNVVGNRVFYVTHADGDSFGESSFSEDNFGERAEVYSVSVDGYDKSDVIEAANQICIDAENEAYYTISCGSMYMMDADGQIAFNSSREHISGFTVAGDRIYFIEEEPGENETSDLDLSDPGIYMMYADASRSYSFSSNMWQLVPGTSFGGISVAGDWLFYTEMHQEKTVLYKMAIGDSTEKIIVRTG